MCACVYIYRRIHTHRIVFSKPFKGKKKSVSFLLRVDRFIVGRWLWPFTVKIRSQIQPSVCMTYFFLCVYSRDNSTADTDMGVYVCTHTVIIIYVCVDKIYTV